MKGMSVLNVVSTEKRKLVIISLVCFREENISDCYVKSQLHIPRMFINAKKRLVRL